LKLFIRKTEQKHLLDIMHITSRQSLPPCGFFTQFVRDAALIE